MVLFPSSSEADYCCSHFQEKQITSTLNKTPYFQFHISILEFISHYVLGHLVVQPCTVWNIQLMATLPYHNPTITTSLWHEFAQISTVLCLQSYARQWVEQCNLTMLGFPIWHQAKIVIRKKKACIFLLSHSLLSLALRSLALSLIPECLAFVTSFKAAGV